MVDRSPFSVDIDSLARDLCQRQVALPGKPGKLVAKIKGALLAANDARVLSTKKDAIHKCVKMAHLPVNGRGNVGIYGGEKDFARTGDKPHFVRADGAWFHFSITVGVHGNELTLPAYNFELVFPDQFVIEHQFPRFLRFDLNPPDHANVMRSHMHPGHDNLSVPAPMMGPLEILHLFLYGGLVPDRELRRQ